MAFSWKGFLYHRSCIYIAKIQSFSSTFFITWDMKSIYRLGSQYSFQITIWLLSELLLLLHMKKGLVSMVTSLGIALISLQFATEFFPVLLTLSELPFMDNYGWCHDRSLIYKGTKAYESCWVSSDSSIQFCKWCDTKMKFWSPLKLWRAKWLQNGLKIEQIVAF